MSTISLFLSGYLGEFVNATPHLGGSALQRFARQQTLADSVEQNLFAKCGLSPSAEPPLAFCLGLAEAKPSTQPRWLVQAVHLQLQRDTFGLAHVPELEIGVYEALSALFNDHFLPEGIRFEPSNTHRYWYLTLPEPVSVNTTPLQTVLGQSIQSYQPTGPDAAMFRRIMNEAQMLLHEHPVNQGRIAQGLPEMNSLWISGGGGVTADTPSATFGGNGRLLQGLGLAFEVTTLLAIEQAVAQQCPMAIVYLEDARLLDWSWLFKQVKYGKVKQLELYIPAPNHTRLLTLTPLDCWKFWRKAAPLHANENN